MRALACCLTVLLTTFSAQADDKSSILCIGDSITQGGKGYPVYRWFLAPALNEAGLDCQFIGTKKDRAGGHYGNGGRNTAWLKDQSKELYAKHPADFVLIHSGHNRFSKDKPVPGILRDTEAMIRTIHAINPKVRVLVAQVIESGKLPKYGYIPELNRQLPSLAKKLSSEGMAVTVVNVAAGFDWQVDTLADKVHPNEQGARKMAQQWLKALKPMLKAATKQ